jgi:hypothetical protein
MCKIGKIVLGRIGAWSQSFDHCKNIQRAAFMQEKKLTMNGFGYILGDFGRPLGDFISKRWVALLANGKVRTRSIAFVARS